MRKTLVAALLCSASFVGVSAGSAFAGEVTGGGDTTPIKGTIEPFPGVPAAICSYSGLEDHAVAPRFKDPGTPAQTQTPSGEPGAARICSVLNSGKGFVHPTTP